MNYEAFTNDSLTMMYEGIRGALRADDDLQRDGQDSPFRVRETPEWKKHASNLEVEMLRRGMLFKVIDWTLSGPRRSRVGAPITDFWRFEIKSWLPPGQD
jgi:hypothetical protein